MQLRADCMTIQLRVLTVPKFGKEGKKEDITNIFQFPHIMSMNFRICCHVTLTANLCRFHLSLPTLQMRKLRLKMLN